MKLCHGRCKELKPLSDFNKNSRSKDGLEYQCRDCYLKRRKELRGIKAVKNGFDEYYERREKIFAPDLLAWTKKLDFIEWMGWSVEDKAGEIDDILACMP